MNENKDEQIPPSKPIWETEEPGSLGTSTPDQANDGASGARTLAMQFIEIDNDFFIYKPFELDLTPYSELKDLSDAKIIQMLDDGTLGQAFTNGDLPSTLDSQMENRYDDTLGWSKVGNVPEAFMEQYKVGSGRGSERWLYGENIINEVTVDSQTAEITDWTFGESLTPPPSAPPPGKTPDELRDSVVGEYEKTSHEVSHFLDSGVFQSYKYGKASPIPGEWAIVDGEIHVKFDPINATIYSINEDSSITFIAQIWSGKRKDVSKVRTLKKIK